VGTLVYVVSSPLVYWGQQARAYLPAVLFLVLAALALVVAVQDENGVAWVFFVASAVLAAYMLLLAALVVVAQIAALSVIGRRSLDVRRVLFAIGVIVLLWTPLLVIAVRQGSWQL